MDISAMLTTNPPSDTGPARATRDMQRSMHPYPTRYGNGNSFSSEQTYNEAAYQQPQIAPPPGYRLGVGAVPMSNGVADHLPGKPVQFRLILSNNSRARLPLDVVIRQHDTVESIVATVRNFYGLYGGEGLNFQDTRGRVVIAQYENLQPGETYFVKAFNEAAVPAAAIPGHPAGFIPFLDPRPQLGEPFQMAPPQPHSRPGSRSTRRRDASPAVATGHRSGSIRSATRMRPADGEDIDSDGGSVSSSRRARSEQVNAEISMKNVVEGGRRNLAKFDSSELPLFAPPQQPVAVSMSSLSPQRRQFDGNMQSPMNMNGHSAFAYNNMPMAYSPHAYNNNNGMMTPHTASVGSGYNSHYHPSGHRLRDSSSRVPLRSSGASNILPTPDPTTNSVISDEDVALQLMRLGDASNLSRGRTSTSTMDDALSGKAELASSDGTDVESDAERPLPKASKSHTSGPARKKIRGANALPQSYTDYTSEDDYDDRKDSSFKGDSDPLGPHGFDVGKSKPRSIQSKSRPNSVASKSRSGKPKTKSGSGKIPPSPYTADTESRKTSTASTSATLQGIIDDEDLSTKPRCQRCRKSKKGCDRQRPCQRCKDAGIGPEGCVSEDEGNGRKGRFGRHMGVPVKEVKTGPGDSVVTERQPITNGLAIDYYGEAASAEASKKRKR